MKWTNTILFCLFGFSVFAQDKKQITADSTQIANTLTYFIESSSLPMHQQVYAYPFDSIIFKDVRFNTADIGVTNKVAFFSDKNKFSYVQFMSGLSTFLNTLINNPMALHPYSRGDKLICYIKKFRITELDSTYEISTKKQRHLQIKSAIDAFYVHDKKLYPAFRTDTTFIQLLSENTTAYFIIDSLVSAFSERSGKIDIEKILSKKSFSEAVIDSTYRKRLDLPILTATNFNKGVYISAKDFFNNAPAITEYEWKPDKKVNILYTKDENNQWVVTRKNIFGFCDGNHIWLRAENSFYPAFRKEGTFVFIAPLYLKRIVNNQPTTYYLPPIGGYSYYITVRSKYSSAYYQDKSVYQVDMETGEFY